MRRSRCVALGENDMWEIPVLGGYLDRSGRMVGRVVGVDWRSTEVVSYSGTAIDHRGEEERRTLDNTPAASLGDPVFWLLPYRLFVSTQHSPQLPAVLMEDRGLAHRIFIHDSSGDPDVRNTPPSLTLEYPHSPIPPCNSKPSATRSPCYTSNTQSRVFELICR
jgi:hypothetical protein